MRFGAHRLNCNVRARVLGLVAFLEMLEKGALAQKSDSWLRVRRRGVSCWARRVVALGVVEDAGVPRCVGSWLWLMQSAQSVDFAIPNRSMALRSVLAGTPSNFAAPLGPPITRLVCASARSM